EGRFRQRSTLALRWCWRAHTIGQTVLDRAPQRRGQRVSQAQTLGRSKLLVGKCTGLRADARGCDGFAKGLARGLKMKNPAAPALKREAGEDWGERWRRR